MSGMTGTGFWAYCDAGRGACWNPYISPAFRWSPVFISRDGIHDSKHWEAFREGLQDYEYLALLRDRVRDARAGGHAGELLTKADQLLAEAPKRVVPPDMLSQEEWWTEADRTIADTEIARILKMLEALAAGDSGTEAKRRRR